MDQLSLYDSILQLSPPWKTTSVELDSDGDSVLVIVSCDSSAQLTCPKCNAHCERYDSRRRQWRHLDTCQYKTFIEAQVPRVKCSSHGVLTINVSWATRVSRYTVEFEASVLKWAQECSVLSLSRRLRLSWNAINGIMHRGVNRGLKRRWEVDCRHLAVDETCIGKGRDFITILSNSKGQVISVSDGRSSESLLRCLASIPMYFLSRVKTITMDFSPAYKKAVNQLFGIRAKKIIAFDHFHVSKMLNHSLNQIRKFEIQQTPSIDRLYHHKTRYTWLRNGGNLSGDDPQTLQELKSQLSNTAMAWYFKETARDIWYTNRKGSSKKEWRQWIALVKQSGLQPLISVAQTITDNIEGIANAINKDVSNARAEAINRKIKDAARRASGYRNRERYKLAILFYFGKLDMAP